MSTRPPEPEFLIQWREWVQAGPPRCCHTCDNYGDDGWCALFDLQPPAEFTHSFNECPEWAEEIPF